MVRWDESKRAAAEAKVRRTRLPLAAVAAQVGVPASTVRYWTARHGWRPVRGRRFVDPAAWPAHRRGALGRLLADRAIDPADLAAALGRTRRDLPALFAACGLPPRSGTAAMPEPGARSLRAALRRQVARQVAGLDAALTTRSGTLDSAKVLRDLGGLKRLIDEIAQDEIREAGDGAGEAHATGRDDLDLPTLRAEIARRYAAFAGERPDAGLPCEPAAAADPGARH